MKRYITILSFLTICVFWGFCQDRNELLTLENEVMYSKILGQDVKYSVCLPENYYEVDQSYPVVYMLHGLGDNASSWLEYGRIDSWSKYRVNQKAIIPMIYIMPEGYTNYYVNDFYGKFLYQDMFVKELIPHIDKRFRTIASREHRATVGYSMGGFGALTLALLHQNLFSVTVTFSISIRTDEQYLKEESEGWDEQWGRLFGGVGQVGERRLTDYYKQNNPFYIIENKPIDTKIFIINGDDEGSLAYSNEELHIRMRELNIPHEYRVRDGGHDFDFWFKALDDGINFVSDAFSQKTYRGDQIDDIQLSESVTLIKDSYAGNPISVYLPKGYEQGNRLYPIIYIDAAIDEERQNLVSRLIGEKIETMELTPAIAVFFDSSAFDDLDRFIESIETKYRVRGGRRFSAYIGFKEGGLKALECISENKFTYVASFDATIEDASTLFSKLKEKDTSKFQKTAVYIDTSDKGEYYKANGKLHLLLKDLKVKHEYRVSENTDSTKYLLRCMDAVLGRISDKIHY